MFIRKLLRRVALVTIAGGASPMALVTVPCAQAYVPDPCPCGPVDVRPARPERDWPDSIDPSPSKQDAEAVQGQHDHQLTLKNYEFTLKGNEAYLQGQWDAAIQLYEQALTYRNDAVTRRNLAKAKSRKAFGNGREASKKGNWDSAIDFFAQAVAYWNDRSSREHLAWARFRRAFDKAREASERGDWGLAIALYESAQKYWRDPATSHNLASAKSNQAFARARELMKKEDWNQAVTNFVHAVELCQNVACSASYRNRLQMYIGWARGQQALRVGNNSLKMKDSQSAAKTFVMATKHFGEALQHEPNNTTILFWIDETGRAMATALASARISSGKGPLTFPPPQGSPPAAGKLNFPVPSPSVPTLSSHHRDNLTRQAQLFEKHPHILAQLASMRRQPAAVVLTETVRALVDIGLSSLEMELFDRDPDVGARVIIHAGLAQRETSRLYGVSAGVDGNGDAFRHMYWNFRMARDAMVGRDWAQRWANAHEIGEAADRDPPDPTVLLQTRMDAYNNRLGRELAARAGDDSPRHVQDAVRNGLALRIVTMDGVRRLVPTNLEGEK